MQSSRFNELSPEVQREVIDFINTLASHACNKVKPLEILEEAKKMVWNQFVFPDNSSFDDYANNFLDNNSTLEYLDKVFAFPIASEKGYDYYEMTFRECVKKYVIVGGFLKRVNDIDESDNWDVQSVTPYNLWNNDIILSDETGNDIIFNDKDNTWRYI
jgi:hypothetical protein